MGFYGILSGMRRNQTGTSILRNGMAQHKSTVLITGHQVLCIYINKDFTGILVLISITPNAT